MLNWLSKLWKSLSTFGRGTAEAAAGHGLWEALFKNADADKLKASFEAFGYVVDKLVPGEASSEALSTLLANLRKNPTQYGLTPERANEILRHLWEYMMRGEEELQRLDGALGAHYKDLADGMGRAMIEVVIDKSTGSGKTRKANVRRTKEWPPGTMDPRDAFMLTWIQILEWQDANPSAPVLESAITFLLTGREGRLRRWWNALAQWIGVDADDLLRWGRSVRTIFFVLAGSAAVVLLVASLMPTRPTLYGVLVVLGSILGGLATAIIGVAAAVLFATPGGNTPSEIFARIVCGTVAGVLSVFILWMILPAGFPAMALTLVALSGIALLVLSVRKTVTSGGGETPVKMGAWGKALAGVLLASLAFGLWMALVPGEVNSVLASGYRDAVSWLKPRSSPDTGRPNRQMTRELDRDAALVEHRGRRTAFDPDTGQAKEELTAGVLAAEKQRFDPYSGKQNRKCFTDPATGKVHEVFDIKRNYDIETRAPLRLCTDKDAKQIIWQKNVGAEGGETREVFVTSREFTFVRIPDNVRYDIKTPDPDERLDFVFRRSGEEKVLLASNRRTARISFGTTGTELGIRLAEREEGIVYLTVSSN